MHPSIKWHRFIQRLLGWVFRIPIFVKSESLELVVVVCQGGIRVDFGTISGSFESGTFDDRFHNVYLLVGGDGCGMVLVLSTIK